jgi:hypothetical protein
VNPFGLTWDARGNLYSADCHSSPIYQLLRGAYYPSFGKPHDGLGFGPVTIQHTHGSTAICAPMYVHDTTWPAELQDHVFIGNVMTSRLNHDAISWHGASSKGKELPDFLSTDDPWFRPVDLQWGPDSALYVADFYNKIIGHYEVPLTHPGRDRERGRIWRIVYRGADGKQPTPKLGPLPVDSAEALVKELGSTNPTRRMLAINELCDRHAAKAAGLAKAALQSPANSFQQAFALWLLHRVNALDEAQVLAALKANDPLVRTHALRIADARKEWSPALAGAVRGALDDKDAICARVAADALSTHPSAENFRTLYGLLRKVPSEDDHLRHSVRMALRDQLREPSVAGSISLDAFDAAGLSAILDVMLAVPGEQTALLRLALFERTEVPLDVLATQLPSLAKNLPSSVSIRSRLSGGRSSREISMPRQRPRRACSMRWRSAAPHRAKHCARGARSSPGSSCARLTSRLAGPLPHSTALRPARTRGLSRSAHGGRTERAADVESPARRAAHRGSSVCAVCGSGEAAFFSRRTRRHTGPAAREEELCAAARRCDECDPARGVTAAERHGPAD